MNPTLLFRRCPGVHLGDYFLGESRKVISAWVLVSQNWASVAVPAAPGTVWVAVVLVEAKCAKGDFGHAQFFLR
jgi:hypothetical protein